MRSIIIKAFFGASLFTLPWVGVGVIHFFTHRDVGGGLQPSWVFMALAILITAAKMIRLQASAAGQVSWKKPHSFLVYITLGTLAAVAVSGVGIHLAPSFESSASAWGRLIRQLLQLVIMLSFLWWAVLWINGSRRWQMTLDFIFLGAAFQVLYSLFQGLSFFLPLPWFFPLDVFFTSNPSILSGSEKLYLNNILQEIPRLRGTACEPLYLGNYLLIAWPFLLVWRRKLWLRLVLGSLFLVLLILTWSRGAWLGFLAQILALVLLLLVSKIKKTNSFSVEHRQGKIRFLPVGLVSLVLLLAAGDILGGGLVIHRLLATFNNQDWSNLTRLYSMKAAWMAFLESPVVGIGWGQFAFHFPLLVDPMGLQSQFSWPVVNNFPLQILCETGLFGFAVFTGVGLFLLRKSFRVLNQNSGMNARGLMVVPAMISVWGVWVQLLSFSQYNLPHIWIGLGLLMAALLDDTPEKSTDEHKRMI